MHTRRCVAQGGPLFGHLDYGFPACRTRGPRSEKSIARRRLPPLQPPSLQYQLGQLAVSAGYKLAVQLGVVVVPRGRRATLRVVQYPTRSYFHIVRHCELLIHSTP